MHGSNNLKNLQTCESTPTQSQAAQGSAFVSLVAGS